MRILSDISDTVQLMFRRPRRSQFAALCYRFEKGMTGPEILLVTSRDTGRWVIPKGWPMGSKAGHKVAAQEALEEAGVIGEAEHRAFGTYSYEKAMPEGVTIPCDVYVHLLKMKSCTKSFKEKGKRLIEWVSPDVAAERVQEPELKALIQTFEQRFEAKKS